MHGEPVISRRMALTRARDLASPIRLVIGGIRLRLLPFEERLSRADKAGTPVVVSANAWSFAGYANVPSPIDHRIRSAIAFTSRKPSVARRRGAPRRRLGGCQLFQLDSRTRP